VRYLCWETTAADNKQLRLGNHQIKLFVVTATPGGIFLDLQQISCEFLTPGGALLPVSNRFRSETKGCLGVTI